MKLNFGKSLTRAELKQIKGSTGGQNPGCVTAAGQLAANYAQGCCYYTTGLVLCPPSNTCQYPANCPAY